MMSFSRWTDSTIHHLQRLSDWAKAGQDLLMERKDFNGRRSSSMTVRSREKFTPLDGGDHKQSRCLGGISVRAGVRALRRGRKQFSNLQKGALHRKALGTPVLEQIITRITGRRTNCKKGYLKKENDIPDESQDNGGVSIGNISCVDTDQLNLKESCCISMFSQAADSFCSCPGPGGTHVSFLQERQHLGDVVKSEDTVGGLLESMKLKIIQKKRNITDSVFFSTDPPGRC